MSKEEMEETPFHQVIGVCPSEAGLPCWQLYKINNQLI